ncbi:MAG: stalk domain-containing protein [Candidatus Cryosericum sp.]
MVLRRRRETVLDTGLVVLLVFMLMFQTMTPSAGVKAADASSVWHLAGQKAQNVSYTDGATSGSLMVNVGTRGAVALSKDLVHWESIEQFTSQDLYGVCWGAGRYVAVGDEGTMYASTDGRAWDKQEISADVGLAGIAYGNGVYVAVGVNGTIVRSSDGATWAVSTAPVDKNLYHVTWGGGRFVAVGQDGAIIASVDGLTWQDRTFAAREDLYGVAWGKDKFVAAGGGSLILTSPDGVTWTQREAAYEDLTFAAVAYAGDAFILAANHDAINQTWDVPTRWAVFYFRSTDGTSWKNMEWQQGYVWKRSSWVRGMLWTGSLLVSFGDNGSAQTSPDGMRWTNRTSARNAVIIGITSGAGTYVGVGTEDNFNGAVYSSTDGVTWQHEANPQVPRSNENYEQWQDDLYAAAYGNGVFVTVGNYGVILRSEDGHTWTVERSGTQDSLLAVVRVGDQFAAVGNNGTLLTSPDGHVWTRRLAAETNLLFWSVAAGRDTLVIMGADFGKKASRTVVEGVPISQLAGVDPISSSTLVAIGGSSGSSWLAQLAYGNGRFVAVADSIGQVWYSDDSLAWTSSAPVFVEEPARAITFAQGVFVAAGDAQTIAVSRDGSSWNVSTSGNAGRNKGGSGQRMMHEDYMCVYGDDKLFVATTSMSGVSLSYDGGENWAGTADNYGDDVTLTAVSDTTSGLVAVGELGCVRTSNDGVLWQRRVTDASGWIWDVTSSPFGVVAVGEFGLVMTSSDLATWTVMEPVTEETLTGIAAGGGHVVAIGDNHVVVSSEDGQTWTAGEMGLDFDVSAVTFGAGIFLAAGQNGVMATSVDGHLWKQVTTGVTVDLDDVAWLNGTFVVAGGGGAILTSTNGVAWSAQKTGTTAALFAVTSRLGLIMAVGDKGTTIVSSDGSHWSVVPSPTKEILYGCAARGDRFVAVGSSETMMWTSDLVVPASPVPMRPATGSTVDAGSATLVWSAIPGNVSYDVQTSTTADFTKLILDRHGLSATSAILEIGDLSVSGMTYWRVRSVGATLASSWSAVQSFTVRTVAPPSRQTTLVLHVASTQMSVDGTSRTIDVAPQIVEGRTLLPIKWVAEPLGALVAWDATDRKVTISLKGTTLELWIGKSQARVNGVAVPIDSENAKVVPLIVSGRTMLPVRFVAEQLGADVQWEASTKTITITGPGQ